MALGSGRAARAKAWGAEAGRAHGVRVTGAERGGAWPGPCSLMLRPSPRGLVCLELALGAHGVPGQAPCPEPHCVGVLDPPETPSGHWGAAACPSTSRNGLAVGSAGPAAGSRRREAGGRVPWPALHTPRGQTWGLRLIPQEPLGSRGGNSGGPGLRLVAEVGGRWTAPGPRHGPDCPSTALSVQVEDAMLDVYDLVYDQAVKGRSGARRQELVAIQDTVSVRGRPPPRRAALGRPACPVACDPRNGHRVTPGVSPQGSGVPRTQVIEAPGWGAKSSRPPSALDGTRCACVGLTVQHD